MMKDLQIVPINSNSNEIQVLNNLQAFDTSGIWITLQKLLNEENPVSIEKQALQYAVIKKDGLDDIYNQIKDIVLNQLQDLDPETKDGSKKIKSLAAQIPRTKAPIKEVCDELIKLVASTMETPKNIIATIRTVYKEYEDKIDALKKSVRAPVTAIEDEEKAYKAKVLEVLNVLKESILPVDKNGQMLSSEVLEGKLNEIRTILSPDLQQNSELIAAHQHALDILPKLIEQAKENELAKVRAKAAEEEAMKSKITAEVTANLLKETVNNTINTTANTTAQIVEEVKSKPPVINEPIAKPEPVKEENKEIINHTLSLELRQQISKELAPYFVQCGFNINDPSEASKIKCFMQLILNGQIPRLKLVI